MVVLRLSWFCWRSHQSQFKIIMPSTQNTMKMIDTGQMNIRNERSDIKNPYLNQNLTVLGINQQKMRDLSKINDLHDSNNGHRSTVQQEQTMDDNSIGNKMML
jgi:hypothetical protein